MMKKNVTEQNNIDKKQSSKSSNASDLNYQNDAKQIISEYEDYLLDKSTVKTPKTSEKSKKESKNKKDDLKTKSKVKTKEAKLVEPDAKKPEDKNSGKKEEIQEEKPTLTKSELAKLVKQLSPEKKQEIIDSYDHTQPELNLKHGRDYRRLRSRTLSAMKKKEKGEIAKQEDPVAKEIFQEIYDQKWKKYFQSNSEGHIIDIRNVRKYYVNGTNAEYILKKLNIRIKTGEIFVILGASGSGKTTLLNIISGLIDASSGDVIVQNKNLFIMNEKNKIKFRADNVSFVFQSYNLIPSLTVEENIKVGASLRPKNTEKISIKEIMKLLDLTDQKNKYPFQLSGGQNQRVSIGRALSKNPKILFADEPTGALDEERGKEALKFLVDINEKYGTTIIMVTHNPNFKWIGDTTLKIHDGEVESLTHNKKRVAPRNIKWT